MEEYYNQLLSEMKVLNPGTKYLINRILNREKYQFLREMVSILIKINEKEETIKTLSQKEMQRMVIDFKDRIQKGEPMDNFLVDIFALVREAARRTLNMRHFDVQILGGIVLHKGKIAEMMTGEGKTLVATLPLVLNAMEGKGCHLVTVNDYLAKRDTQWMGPIYHYLGLSVGCIISWKDTKEPYTLSAFIFDPTYLPPDSRFLYLRPVSRKEAYNCDITYGVASEFGFDYLRDNMAISKELQVQRELNYAIIDEVDSVLIDEARTPLIISGPSEEATNLYYEIDRLVRKLNKDTDFILDEEGETVSFTEEGVHKCERLLGIQNLYDGVHTEKVHLIHQALRAHHFFKRDKEYVVKDGKVIIVDEFTGRLMPGRRWSDGLHQAIEAKEGLPIESENQTLATISFQNYFKLYKKIAGMTGTALTEAVEFKEIYNTDVIVLPPNRKLNRKEYNDEIYKTEKEKFGKIVAEIEEIHKTGRPVLVGTISIEKAERLSRMLTYKGIPHKVLHGKNHEAEAAIIAQAGRPGAVTIATQMAGRGVDIILGGNPEILAREETIRVIWSRKKSKEKGTYGEKEFAEILSETERTYKEQLVEIDRKYKPLIEEKRRVLNEKENIFFTVDKKARELFEEMVFEKEGGDVYRRYKERLEKMKQVYEKANEQLITAQKEAGDKYEFALKDIKESAGRAYREYISFKNSLKSRANIVLDEDIEDIRNRFTELLNSPDAETDEGRKIILEVLEKYRNGLKRFFEIITGCFAPYLPSDIPPFKKAYKYLQYINDVLSSQRDTPIKEIKEKETVLYAAYTEQKKELERLILSGISDMDYQSVEADYRKALMDYEKVYAEYEENLKKAREEYERNRSRYEEEWRKAREELEKTPEEFKDVYESLLEKYKKPWIDDHNKVVSLGGLHIIGSERYESRRIDNQLKGRAGRQGDPGSSKFYLSLDDDLLRIFGSERMRSVMNHLPEGEAITHPLINRMITNAQKKVEARNFEIRKQLLEFDNVLNEQRRVIYTLRQDILEGQNLDTYIEEFIEETLKEFMDAYMNEKLKPVNWSIPVFISSIKNTFDITVDVPSPDTIRNPVYWKNQFAEELTIKLKNIYHAKKKEMGQYISEIQKIIMLQVIDNRWKAHLRVIDELREGINLRAYAQRDPLLAYKQEGYQAFQEMLSMIKREILSHLFRVKITETPVIHRREDGIRNVSYSHKSLQQFEIEQRKQNSTVIPADTVSPEQSVRPAPYVAGKKIGRNEPCPCGSGKKYKKCCGKNM